VNAHLVVPREHWVPQATQIGRLASAWSTSSTAVVIEPTTGSGIDIVELSCPQVDGKDMKVEEALKV
jgi:hypothetical protein